MKNNEKFRDMVNAKHLDLSSLDLKKVQKKRVSATALIPKRRERIPINAISQNFHIITRPQRIDCSKDQTINSQNSSQGYDYKHTGMQRYFSKDYIPIKPSPKQEFPRIRQKMYSRPCRGDFETEVGMVPYEKRIKTTTDLSILKSLNKSNSELKARISEISQLITQTFNRPEIKKLSKEPEARKHYRLKKSRSEKSRLENDLGLQKTNHQIENLRNSFSETSKTKKLEKPSKVTHGVVDVSYPYCKCCKRDWFKSIDVQE